MTNRERAGNKTFTVWCVSRGETREEGVKFEALYAGEAAEKWADYDDSYGDYDIVAQRSVPIVMVAEGDDQPEAFEVHGEAIPNYTAYSVPAPVHATGEGEA